MNMQLTNMIDCIFVCDSILIGLKPYAFDNRLVDVTHLTSEKKNTTEAVLTKPVDFTNINDVFFVTYKNDDSFF
jgi:hypothetical protein